MKRRELTEKRTANTKVFENQDHSMTREIYLEAIHYQEEDGSWKEMNDTLEEEDVQDGAEDAAEEPGGMEAAAAAVQAADKKNNRDFVNKKGRLKIRFKNHAKEQGTVTITKDGASLTWGLEGALKAAAQKNSSSEILYTDVLKGMNLRCRVTGERVKEDLILTGPDSPGTAAFLYQMKKLSAVQGRNQISFVNEQGEEVFLVTAPYMKDAAGEMSEAVTVTLEEEKKNRCRIIFQADEAWLRAPERKYPVVIDPVTTTSKKRDEIMDAHVDSQYEEDNFQHGIFLKTHGGNIIQRSFVKFTLPEIKTGDMVIDAKLCLVSLAEDGNSRAVEVHKVLQNWDFTTINWYNKPAYEETVQDVCQYKADMQKYISLDITRLVKDWYQNGSNFGLMFKDAYELSGSTEFLSADCDDGYQNMRPKIEITYVNYSGLEDFWTYHSQDVGRAGTVHVNDYNGNLILVHQTLSMGGSRMPVSLEHVFNSNDANTNIGYGNGFRLNYHQKLKKVTIAGVNYYKHTDGDGTIHYFRYDDNKKLWKDELGLELTLTINSGSSEPYIIKDKENNQLVFNSSGYLIKIRDKNSNALTIGYSGGRISKLTDGAVRFIKKEQEKLLLIRIRNTARWEPDP